MIRSLVQSVKQILANTKNPGLRLTPTPPKETPMLIYDGVLTTDIQRWCEDSVREYGYVVEVREFPHHTWYQTLKQRTWYQNCDSMGGDYVAERKGPLYGVIHTETERDEDHRLIGGGFIFLKDREDYDKALADLEDLIVNPKPFKTMIKGSITA